MSETTIQQLFSDMGYPYQEMLVNQSVDVSHLQYEVKSIDKSGNDCWELIKSIVRKDVTDSYVVPEVGLVVSPLHKFWARVSGSEPHWVEAVALTKCNDVQLFTENHEWIDVHVEHNEMPTEILDIEVENTSQYFTNGVLSHNTMHGDPHITPGGKAVPFHSSVRIRLGSGAPIIDKNKNVIGINVTVSIKKNKVAMPYRKCSFHIIFGKGVDESEQIFDEVRRHCEQNGAVTKSGYEIMISGSGGWKDINVNDATTGEVIATKKFHKAEFGDLMKSKEFGPFIAAAIEATYTLSEDSSEFAMADEESQDDSSDEVLDD